MGNTNLKLLDEKLEKERTYWARKLAGVAGGPGLTPDFKRPSGGGAALARESVTLALDAETAAKLFKLCGRNEPLVFSCLVAALKIYLHKTTGREDVTVGTAIYDKYAEHAALNKVLALRDAVRADSSVRELLLDVKNTVAEAFTHQRYPFASVLDLSEVEDAAERGALFSVVALLENIQSRENVAHLEYDAAFFFAARDGAVTLAVEYDRRLFKRETVALAAEHYTRLLRALLDDPEQPVARLGLLSPEKRRELLYDFNDTRADYPAGRTIHELFGAQAARKPDSTAVVYGAETLTYAELERRADSLAAYLRGRGVGRGTRVALMMEHAPEVLVAVLGVLKAGGAYVPIDPGHPRARVAFILADAGAPVLLTQQHLVETLPPHAAEVVCVDAQWEEIEQFETGNASGPATAEDLAYVIYTSGSTGEPKGVRVAHRSLVNYIWWAREVYLGGEPCACALYSSLAFDLTVTSVFMPLVTGGEVVIYRKRGPESPLAEILDDDRVDLIKLTPSHLSLIKGRDNRGSRVRKLIVGGEAFESKLASEIHESFGGGVEIYNEYGPTEATVGCMIYRYDPAVERATVPVGRPAANARIYILDERLSPSAENVVGDLYIAGACLAVGYLNRARLTADCFVADPFSSEPGARMYRSGDLARHLPGGGVEYIGRRDEQVKYHGHRVELNEIRCALNRHPQVRDSVVVLAKDKRGDDVMVAYYVARQAIAGPELRAFLAESVYEETIPSMWMHLRRLPLTLNGKVNHAALPTLEEVRERNRQRYVAPRTLEERALAGIWADVLGVEQVGLEDSFFELGGHSLIATQVISRVRSAFGVDIPLRSLFEARTVALLAEVVAGATAARAAAPPPIPRAARTEALPLSFAQQRLWFMDQLEPGGSAYNVPTALRLVGALDAGALAHSLSEVVRRHESLRTTFDVAGDGQPVQVVNDATGVDVPLNDLRHLTDEARDDEARKLAQAEAKRPFDLTRGPLLRAALLRLADDEHVLLLTMHHIVSDGWSMGVLVREVAALYEAFVRGVPTALPELPIQYADFAVWQREHLRGETLARQLDYWRQQLGTHVAPLELPVAGPRPAAPTFRGAKLDFSFGPELARALGELSRREGATTFMVLLAAFKALLHRYTGEEIISVGTPIANRTRGELEGLIGFFVNTLVMRTRVRGAQSFRELLGRVRETALGAYAHQDIAFEKLVEELQPERTFSHTPLFQIMFIFQNAPTEALALPGLDVQPLDAYSGTVKFDLVLNMREDAGGLHGALEYSADLFDGAAIERLLGHFENVLRSVAADEGQRVARLPLLTGDERRQLLEDWGLCDDYAPGHTLHGLFEAQAARDPEATAVTFGGERLSYGRLNEMSNQLAHGLAGLGAGPGRRVAVMLADGPAQVAALLGVLKAGGAFVCLDPQHPTPRLRQILDEVEPACLLTDETCAAGHAELFADPEGARGLRVVMLDADGAAWFESALKTNPAVEVCPSELAYVVYTSGSTGRPKGIMQSHESFCQFVHSFGRQFGLGAGQRVAQWASVSYDAAYAEIFGALSHGATLYMTTRATKADPRAVYEWVRDEEVTVLQSVPSFCGQLLRVVEDHVAAGVSDPLPHLRAMLVAGEVLRPELARAWLSRFAARAPLYNLYGPTESVLATCHRVAQVAADEHSVPVGRALEGRQILVLDGEGEPCPVGVPGEIYVRSPYLSAGYFGDAAETARHFLPDALGACGAGRLYRTGDVGSWRPDGTLKFHGRLDHQVKVRGVRVELADIEAALSTHARVRECAVVLQEYGESDARLVAHVLAQPGADAAELREHLRAALPDYMVPSAFLLHERLPRTASGKIDRRQLPAPDPLAAPEPGADFVAPRTELEREVAGVWQAVLRVERVGVNDNFFHLGGHSLLATQMINQLRQKYEVSLPLRGFIEAPTVANLAGNIAALRSVRHGDLGQLERLLAQVRALSEEEVRAHLDAPPPPQPPSLRPEEHN